MAKGIHSFIFLAFLSFFTVSSHGTLVGFFYHAKENAATSASGKSIVQFLKLNEAFSDQIPIQVFIEDHKALNSLPNTGVSFDLLLKETEVEKFLNSQTSAFSLVKSNLVNLPPHVKINSIAVSFSNVSNDLAKILHALELVDSVISSLHLKSRVGVSVAFPLSCLEALSRTQEKDLHRILDFIKKAKSSVIVKDSIDGELIVEDDFGQVVVERARFVTSILSSNGVPVVLTISSPVIRSAKGLAELVHKFTLSLENNSHIMSRIAGIYIEVSSIEDFGPKELERKEEDIFHVYHRELLNSVPLKTTLHDMINPPTVFPSPLSPTTGLTTPPGSSTPTIVTVPSTNPVTVTPTSPSTPVQIPSTTPVPVPPTNPGNSPLPVTNPENTPPPTPIPGAQTGAPVTNPPPSPVTPVTTPVTNPVGSPGNPGQSWCVAKTGVSETALQAALDYACGIGGADCSQIQPGASCFSPESLENHASYAFNSYYQKHPGPTSCDFGGSAMISNANPSTGSCIYPSSSSATSSTPPSTPTTPPPTTVSPPLSTTPPSKSATPPPPAISPPKSTTPSTTISPPTSPGSGLSGSGFPPLVWNSTNPASPGTTGFGLDSPPTVSTTDSGSADLQPFIGCIVLITLLITGKFILTM